MSFLNFLLPGVPLDLEMPGKVSAPADRQLQSEMEQTIRAQLNTAPDIYAARQQYDPLYADLAVQNYRRALLGNGSQPGLLSLYGDVAPTLNQFSADASRYQRQADVADVEALAGRTTTALRNADPTAAAIEDQLAKQAQAELASGASLDPALANQVSQSVRAAQAARGFGMGTVDANVEGLFAGREAEQLRRQRQAFASSVAAQRRQTNGDPFLAILGRPAQSMQLTGQSLALGQTAQGTGPTFDPYNQYAQDLYNTNYNARAAAKIATANNEAAITGAAISAFGNIAGGM